MKNNTAAKNNPPDAAPSCMAQDNAVQDNSIQDNSIQDNSIQDNSIQGNSIQDNSIQNNSVQDKKTDRRVRRTRTLLQQSLIRLMAEKEIRDITVKELTDLADITRGTFYLHYCDIYDILRSMEYEMFVEFNEILSRSDGLGQEESTPEAILADIFSLLERRRDMARVMMGPHGDLAFVNRLKNLVKERIYQVLARKKTGCEYDYAEAFAVSGCIGVIETWLYHPAPLPPREIARICCNMLVQGLDLT